MPRRVVPEIAHAALAGAYRESPGDFNAAARAAGVDRRTARRAWLQGWPGRPAIKDALAEEQQLTRQLLSKTALLAERERAPGDAQLDSARQAAGEALICRVVRGAAVDLLSQLLPLRAYASRLAKRMLEEGPDAVPRDELLPRIKMIGDIAKQGTDLARDAMELERLRLGQPTDFLGLVPMTAEAPIDDETAVRELEAAQRALGWAIETVPAPEEKSDAAVAVDPAAAH